MSPLMLGVLVLLQLSSLGPARDADCPPGLPTGWVDRVEGAWVVVEVDGPEDGEEVPVPGECFPVLPREGWRLVEGIHDPEETRAMQARIDSLLDRLLVPAAGNL